MLMSGANCRSQDYTLTHSLAQKGYLVAGVDQDHLVGPAMLAGKT